MGLSLGKLILLAILIVAVIYGFRLFRALQDGRLDAQRRRRVREGTEAESVVDLERNPRTGAFEPRRPPDRRDG